jgi:preprotein translocase subunit SecA
VKIVDEFTGRILEGRRWSEGLHQAVEAKEGVKIKEENQTLATVTLQNYFRMYDKLAGMTGTAETEASELASTYTLQVVPIPTHRPMVRLDQSDLIYKSEDAKFDAVIDDVIERVETGQPVLLGTASVEKSEKLSRLLEKRGVVHEVLNAKQHFREAEIVTQAGRLGAVTVATNMAGRGVDILLGGNPEGLALHDLTAEGFELDTPEGLVRYEQLLAEHREHTKAEGAQVRELGGLYVLGTERHESRRIDNQLRGRSGRQGDPGESRFYLSLDDELMRIFATGAMSWVMGKALPDDVPIEAKMVSKAIERAQNTVEQRNAEIRKNVLKYDEVMNEQRKVIYKRRDQILEGGDLRESTLEAIAESIDGLVTAHAAADYAEDWDVDGLLTEVHNYWPTDLTIDDLKKTSSSDELYETLMTDASALYERREAELTPEIMRHVERQVMLRIIDTRWREHLGEMDYLREGIHLRAMGQKDPAVEWQREGFEMFGHMMTGVNDDFVRYITHVQVAVEEQAAPVEELRNVQYTAAEDNAPSLAAIASASSDGLGLAGDTDDDAPAIQQPVVKSDLEKTPRNAPCPCGSGKKFKLCHGR